MKMDLKAIAADPVASPIGLAVARGVPGREPRRFGLTRILAACAFLLIAPAILLPYWLALACGVGIAGGAALIRDTVRYCAAVTVGPKP